MKKIKLCGKHGRGHFALVDDEDYKRINKHKWFVTVTDSGMYAYRIERENGKYIRHIRMSREILNAPVGLVAEHAFRKTLDNRKFINGEENLRLATTPENGANRKMNINNKTGYKGVVEYRHPDGTSYFRPKTKVNGKVKWLGTYETDWEAAVAWNHYMSQQSPRFFTPNPVQNWEDITPISRDKDTFIRRDSKTGIRGVQERNGQYRARKHKKGVNFDSGYWQTPEKALEVLQSKMDEYKGDQGV